MTPHSPIAVQVWTPPMAAEAAGALTSFLQHKGSPWIEDIARRLAGAMAGAADYFYAAICDGQLVGHAWYTVASAAPQVGLVGHIFTHPAYRRQGIAAQLLARIVQDFAQRGGQLLQLFTSTAYSVPFYERLGFENLCAGRAYHDTDWYLRAPAGSTPLVNDWYAPPAVAQRRLTGADLPQYCLLYNSEHGSRLKDRAQRVGSGLEAELAFIEATAACAAGQGLCVVRENSRALVGTATLVRSTFPYESHVALFDYYVHAAHRASALALGDACLAARSELGAEVIYAVASEADKCQVLTALGFAPCGDLPGHYRTGHTCLSARLFRWS